MAVEHRLAVLDAFGEPAGGDRLPPFGLGTGEGFYDIKGVRDITSGLVPLALLIAGQRRALGWVLVAESFTPFGDAVIVLTHGGPLATALFVHTLTALFVLATAGLLLRETGRARRVEPAQTAVNTPAVAVG